MEITRATTNDTEGILKLQNQVYRVQKPPANAAQILNQLIESHEAAVLVAKENGQILGSAILYYLKNPGHPTPFAYLEGLVVDEQTRGKGVGKALAQKAIDLAKENKCYKMLATSKEGKDDVHSFYESLGFVKWGLEFRMEL